MAIGNTHFCVLGLSHYSVLDTRIILNYFKKAEILIGIKSVSEQEEEQQFEKAWRLDIKEWANNRGSSLRGGQLHVTTRHITDTCLHCGDTTLNTRISHF